MKHTKELQLLEEIKRKEICNGGVF